ncbi:hypothetical protein ASPBRDRAFT_189662 [Aspergillus brasiliensis CBS 101740]|uniref:Alpha-acetolactate decarboxylase n=1 Tax=Aspergillus brasiliensis (strain CBS 101740 / IMI 381727 / IBT 21946) TaxID=767769 RepID=A0A1L9U2U8_ASPBC|nr:hypothetical protein ASPBRDRAFT_189662 [Aspergillus brasiliensis CBS 101740]
MSPNTLYQYNTISALMHGICADGLLASSLANYGTCGIGTISDLDGEIIILDSEVYHFPSNYSTTTTTTAENSASTVRTPAPTERIPFAMLTTFQPTHSIPLPRSYDPLTSQVLSSYLFSQTLEVKKNHPLAIRLTTTFTSLTIRVIPKRTSTKETLATCAARQSISKLGPIEGTLFGFWSPQYMAGLGVPGFHLHFLSNDKQRGGHVLDFETCPATEPGQGHVEVAVLRKMEMEVPDTEEFGKRWL